MNLYDFKGINPIQWVANASEPDEFFVTESYQNPNNLTSAIVRLI